MKDERLRDLLEEQARKASASSEAWERIRDRAGSRRYVRVLALGLATVVVAGIAFAAPKLISQFGRRDLEITTPASSPSPSGVNAAQEEEFSDRAFWPRSDAESARAYQGRIDKGADPWMLDPEQVAERFAQDFIGWKSIVPSHDVEYDSSGSLRMARLHLRPVIGEGTGIPGTPHALTLVALAGVESPAWFVAGIASDDVEVTEPLTGAEISSPVRIRGAGVGYEATLHPEIRDDSGLKLHPRPDKDPGYIMAGSTEKQPFEASLEFNPATRPRGILIVTASTGIEGPSPDWTITRIRFTAYESQETASSPAVPYAADDGADAALRCFFGARVRRDLEEAKRCMTSRFAATFDQASFAGTSNPHITRFTIVKDYSRTENEATIAVVTYEASTPSEADSYSEDTFVVVKDEKSGDWLVEEWKRGASVAISGATSVKVFFLQPGYADLCPGDAGYQSAWTDESRRIPAGTGPQAQRALEELFTGPAPRPQPGGHPVNHLPLSSRLVSFRIENETAYVDVSRATERGGNPCLIGIRGDQIRKTLLQFSFIKDVVIFVEGERGSLS